MNKKTLWVVLGVTTVVAAIAGTIYYNKSSKPEASNGAPMAGPGGAPGGRRGGPEGGRPVPYPGRTPHIHFAVFPEGERPFVTQLYVRGEPLNARDGLFNDIPADRRELVLANFTPAQGAGAELMATFNVILDLTPHG